MDKIKPDSSICSFCRKDSLEVDVLVQWESANICNECVVQCVISIAHHGRKEHEMVKTLTGIIHLQETGK